MARQASKEEVRWMVRMGVSSAADCHRSAAQLAALLLLLDERNKDE